LYYKAKKKIKYNLLFTPRFGETAEKKKMMLYNLLKGVGDLEQDKRASYAVPHEAIGRGEARESVTFGNLQL
jgi:hypothetical protein